MQMSPCLPTDGSKHNITWRGWRGGRPPRLPTSDRQRTEGEIEGDRRGIGETGKPLGAPQSCSCNHTRQQRGGEKRKAGEGWTGRANWVRLNLIFTFPLKKILGEDKKNNNNLILLIPLTVPRSCLNSENQTSVQPHRRRRRGRKSQWFSPWARSCCQRSGCVPPTEQTYRGRPRRAPSPPTLMSGEGDRELGMRSAKSCLKFKCGHLVKHCR